MPRPVKIHEKPNPTGLTMRERALALDVLRSFEASVERERTELFRTRSYLYPRSATQEMALRERIFNSAYRQFAGRQKSDGGLFQLETHVGVDDDDMAYVMRSLGAS